MTLLQGFRRAERAVEQVASAEAPAPPLLPDKADLPQIDIAPNDPLIVFFQSANGAVDLETLSLESPALEALRSAGIKLVVPLVSQGELIGLLNLGPRLSEQDYSSDDRKLLENLASQAAPAVRVAQLVREQQAVARERQRIEHELEVARLIQQNFLPHAVPDLPGWQLEAYYHPAREVGGDFYDFLELPDGHLGLVIADVTDKGVPAALVMAATRSVLRASAQRVISPGQVLERVNELLCPDMPANMFVTCLYAVLDPASGHLRYANAGHDLPYMRTASGEVVELRARGMPLGLMPDMSYEEKETRLGAGDEVLFHSDGLAEAHNQEREMFGFPRLKEAVGRHADEGPLVERLLQELVTFTGPDWEQEDDVTLVVLRRPAEALETEDRRMTASEASGASQLLAEFEVPSEPGNERLAIARVAAAVGDLNLPQARLERLKTAVGEATMNAIEHGNKNRPDLPVGVRVLLSDSALSVLVSDHGGETEIPEVETPDLDAKLAGVQSPRGWGLFLIKNMVDEMKVVSDEQRHTVELTLYLEGEADADQTV